MGVIKDPVKLDSDGTINPPGADMLGPGKNPGTEGGTIKLKLLLLLLLLTTGGSLKLR